MKRVLVCAVVASSPGCDVATSDLYADFEVIPVGSQLKVTTYLYEGSESSDLFELDGGDHLVAVFRGREQTLTAHGGYTGTFDLDAPLVADEAIAVELRRDSEKSATATTMTMPAEPIVDPIPAFVSRAKDLIISWSPATDDVMGWSLESLNCFRTLYGDIPSGATTATIAASSYELGTNGNSTCSATLTVRRARIGTVDPAFSGGRTLARWEKIFELASTP